MVASNHLLRPLDYFIFEDVESLLKLGKARGNFGFFLSELRVLIDLRLDFGFYLSLHLREIVFRHIKL